MSIEFLSYYLCSRMCHDLSSSVGATSNCIDLLDEDRNENADTLNLAKQSINMAVNQLKFYRSAFGVTQNSLNFKDTKKLANLVIPNKRISLEWDETCNNIKFNPGTLQLILNLLLVAKDFLPTGGLIFVNCDTNKIFVRIKSEKIDLDKDIIEAFNGTLEKKSLSSKNAPSFLINKLALEKQIDFDYSLEKENIYLFKIQEKY